MTQADLWESAASAVSADEVSPGHIIFNENGTFTRRYAMPIDSPREIGKKGQADALAHLEAKLGAATCRSIRNILEVVASSHATFSWNTAWQNLPDGIKQQLETPALQNACGGLMGKAAKRYGWVCVGFERSERKSAHGRMIRVYARKPL